MIVAPKPNFIGILTTLRGSIARKIAVQIIMVTLLASLIVYIEGQHPQFFSHFSATPFTLLGISLSIFMSFRNNACYDRWWEGRKAWGKVLVEVRSFIRESVVITDPATRTSLLSALCGYTHALNARLRNEDEFEAAHEWLSCPETEYGIHVSAGILRQIGHRCSELEAQQQISEWRYITLEQRLTGLSEAQAVCERLKFTPLPFPYTLLLHRTIYLFCVLLPFVMAQPLGWLAPVFTAIVSYTFFGLDAISDQLEDPFGHDDNDLPTDALVRTVEREILDSLGHTELPPALVPIDHVLN